MESSFWHERWQKNDIGFHQPVFHPYLLAHWPRLGIPAGSAVFVPLCGKSLDMFWLHDQGYQVIGVELSPLAVADFFRQRQLEPTLTRQGDFAVYEIPGIRIYCGDFFKLAPADLDGVRGVFDRAALVALPPALRQAYAAHLQEILPAGTQTLLVCFAYPQEQMQGPPFSVEAEEVNALFSPSCSVRLIERHDVLDKEPRFKQRGLTRLEEEVFLLQYR